MAKHLISGLVIKKAKYHLDKMAAVNGADHSIW
jgi:hypothetical protein